MCAVQVWPDSDDKTDDVIRSSPQLKVTPNNVQGAAPQCRSNEISEATCPKRHIRTSRLSFSTWRRDTSDFRLSLMSVVSWRS